MYHTSAPFSDRVLSKLIWGPSTDPNKLAPPMSQYHGAEEWPVWCRVSTHVPHLIKSSFLNTLPSIAEGKRSMTIMNEVDKVRLQSLTHYKSHRDWNHEFVRADFVDESTKTPLVAVWERDFCPTNYDDVKVYGRSMPGLPCESIDRVTYITEKDFAKYLDLKSAYPLRTANFSSPGPDFLQVAAVLETHSLAYPMTQLYSTMCYWYADSTFEVLVDIGDGQVKVSPEAFHKKGFWIWGSFEALAYSGVTRKGLAPAGAATNTTYLDQLVQIQKELIKSYGATHETVSGNDDTAPLTEAERESIKKHGWNVAKFLSVIQEMPEHEVLLRDSVAREKTVRAQLEAIQNGHEEREEAERRRAEGATCAAFENDFAKKESKWKTESAQLRASLEHEQQLVKEYQQRAKEYQQRAKEYQQQEKEYQQRAKEYQQRMKEMEQQEKEMEQQEKEMEQQEKENQQRVKERQQREKEYQQQLKEMAARLAAFEQATPK